MIALWPNNKNENINHENSHGCSWRPKNEKINERMIMFGFNIFVMKWFGQGFIDYSLLLSGRLSSRSYIAVRSFPTHLQGRRIRLWIPGFGIFNLNSLIILMLSLFSTIWILIAPCSILNLTNCPDYLDINWEFGNYLR